MDPTVTAALVAGGVSLLGIIVQIYIVRRARGDASNSLKQQTRTSSALHASNEIKQVQTEAEKLRVIGWSVLVKLQNMCSVRPQETRTLIEELSLEFEELGRQAGSFLAAWAEVKADVPPSVVDYARSKRHDCRTMINRTLAHWKLFVASSKPPSESDEHLRTVVSDVRSLLTEVDDFDQIMRYVRQGVLDSVTV
jgi:hypothetical protein